MHVYRNPPFLLVTNNITQTQNSPHLNQTKKEPNFDSFKKQYELNQGYLYISVEILIGEKRQWNNKNYIALLCTDELMSEVRKHLTDNIIVNF